MAQYLVCFTSSLDPPLPPPWYIIDDIKYYLQQVQQLYLIITRKHVANAGLKLGQSRRRWANIKPSLSQYYIVAGELYHNYLALLTTHSASYFGT